MSETGPTGRPPTDEELAAAYEEQLKQIRVEDVLIQTLVSLLNLGGRKAGLSPGTESERDPEQVRQAIEGIRALLPVCEPLLGPDAAQIRDALSQLQLAYAQISGASAGTPAGDGPPAAEHGAAKPEEPRPGQSSGRLWVPGQ
ncbi:MAG: hypothetical protein QOH62_1846 [Solirubrobacteraceae bacterium]|jgi:hypothetical protein|nr:hypothetical protein [Solirubrobacteraceae bacterium]